MLRSMTGYGRSETADVGRGILVEARSINHRFCDISLKIPQRCYTLEKEIKRLVASRIRRGRVDISIQIDAAGQEEPDMSLNIPFVRRYHLLLKELQKLLHLPGEITLEHLLAQKECIVLQAGNHNSESDWETLKVPLESALDALVKMRETEGLQLREDFLLRLAEVERLLDEIQTIADGAFAAHHKNLLEKIQLICKDISLDESRLAQEVAYLAEKSDISEELTRARSHILQFRSWLDSDDVVGRKLEFLLQEIHREVNTISSKSYHGDISLKSVEIKNELERIREQLQNVE